GVGPAGGDGFQEADAIAGGQDRFGDEDLDAGVGVGFVDGEAAVGGGENGEPLAGGVGDLAPNGRVVVQGNENRLIVPGHGEFCPSATVACVVMITRSLSNGLRRNL